MTYLSTRDAATRLGITPRRVLALVKSGRLPSVKIGPAHMILVADLVRVEDRPNGRPPLA